MLPTETDGQKKTWLVDISLNPIGVLRGELRKQEDKEYDEMVLEAAKKNKQLEGL
jgi:hypothetical protein